MEDVQEYSVSNSDSLPTMDLSYLGGNGYDPINELMRAIILRTIDDYSAGGEFYEEAVEYMRDEDEDYIFAFRSICNHLGLNPEKTRHYIMHAATKISTRRRAA